MIKVMNGLTPQLIALFATTGIGVWMAVAGVHKNALEWRRQKRTCPSCGRVIPGRTCGCGI
jgi:hypothetical protein